MYLAIALDQGRCACTCAIVAVPTVEAVGCGITGRALQLYGTVDNTGFLIRVY